MESELKILLKGWLRGRGIADVESNDRGDYTLLFDGEYEVQLSQLTRTITLEADLGSLSSDRAAASSVLDEIMRLQLADSKNAMEVLALDSEDNHLVLFRNLQAERLNAERFADALSEFVNGLEFWMRELKTLRAPAPSPMQTMTVVHA